MAREETKQLKTQVGLKPYQSRLKDFQQEGSEYRANCPWHEATGKHSPSLAVFKGTDGDWMFKCMAGASCEKHKGDVITFVQQMDGLTFTEALQKLRGGEGIAEPVAPTKLGKPSVEQFLAARQYLTDSGVSMEIAKAGGVDVVIHPKLGLAIQMPYDAEDGVIKYRCVGKEKNKASKFLHASGRPSDELLYNIKRTEKQIENAWGGAEVFVVESERDCLMMNSLGFMAVSVSSATACVNHEGKLKIDEEWLEILERADTVLLALDQDPAGQACADAFEASTIFSPDKVKRIKWPYGGKRSGDPKDIGDLYKQDPAAFKDKIEALAQEAMMRPPKWRQQFCTPDEMEDGEIIQLIEGFMPEGNIGIGGLSGGGKTFLALSITKALTTGQPFVGYFKVPKIVPVLYLIPEVGARQFKKRIKAFGIPMNDDSVFLVRTLSNGATLPLDHPDILRCVRNLHNPVVILDTAIRFSKAKDENSASDNLWMEQACRGLREAGCIAVVPLHHSPKNNAKVKDFTPSLENTFRGTGDIGALLDLGYNIRVNKKAVSGQSIIVECVKARDFEAPNPFALGLRYLPPDSKTGKLHSFIDETGDLMLLSRVTSAGGEYHDRGDTDAAEMLAAREGEKGKAFVDQVTGNPQMSKRSLQDTLKMRRESVNELAKTLGFEMVDGTWVDVLAEEPVSAD